jgi:hypothetical protein
VSALLTLDAADVIILNEYRRADAVKSQRRHSALGGYRVKRNELLFGAVARPGDRHRPRVTTNAAKKIILARASSWSRQRRNLIELGYVSTSTLDDYQRLLQFRRSLRPTPRLK